MTSTELSLLPTKETALQVFSSECGLDPYLAQIKKEIDAFVPDVSTKKGRDAIASIAHKVARSKTALDNVGKELVAELKDIPRKVDAERKRMRDLLDQWKEEVRKPLTEWEEAEKARVATHQTNLTTIKEMTIGAQVESSAILRHRISHLNAITIDSAWQEFESEAHRVKAETLEALNAALVERESYEAEQAELERLRAEEAARAQKEREERIAREAAEAARRDAEAKANAEREAAIKREAEERAAAERRELELKLAAERAEREAIEAKQREERAVAEAEARAKQAAELERQRIADEKAAEEAEAKRRERNRAHKAAINSAAKQALIEAGIPAEHAEAAIKEIALGKVPNVSISY